MHFAVHHDQRNLHICGRIRKKSSHYSHALTSIQLWSLIPSSPWCNCSRCEHFPTTSFYCSLYPFKFWENLIQHGIPFTRMQTTFDLSWWEIEKWTHISSQVIFWFFLNSTFSFPRMIVAAIELSTHTVENEFKNLTWKLRSTGCSEPEQLIGFSFGQLPVISGASHRKPMAGCVKRAVKWTGFIDSRSIPQWQFRCSHEETERNLNLVECLRRC